VISMAILALTIIFSTNFSNSSSNNLTNKINLGFSIKSDFEWLRRISGNLFIDSSHKIMYPFYLIILIDLHYLRSIHDRHARSSTIIASQLPVASWYDVIGEGTIADDALDRSVHTSHRIELKGESIRKKRQ